MIIILGVPRRLSRLCFILCDTWHVLHPIGFNVFLFVVPGVPLREVAGYISRTAQPRTWNKKLYNNNGRKKQLETIFKPPSRPLEGATTMLNYKIRAFAKNCTTNAYWKHTTIICWAISNSFHQKTLPPTF